MNPFWEHINALAAQDPERVALIECDEAGNTTTQLTRSELAARVESFIHEYSSRSAPLILEGESTADFLVRCWAAWAAGLTVVPLDTRRDTTELRAYKTASAARAQPGDALILFTSGTTARPKGARLTLKNLMVNADAIRNWLGITEADRFLVLLPLYHINSTTLCLSALRAGATIILPPRYSNSHFWQAAAATGATYTSVVQSIVHDQLARKTEFAAVKNSLRLTRIQIGSAPVIPETAREFIRLFGIPLYQGYGQTETALRVTGVPRNLPPALYDRLVEENSIGTALPWADAHIVGENGAECGENMRGELRVRGDAIMQGYVGDEPAFDARGYFMTGDIGYFKTIDGHRFYFLDGRKSELIIKGGVNVSPAAVENALQKISPDIEQVYAVGVADDRYGEEIGAAVVWHEGTDRSALRKLQIVLLRGTHHISMYETPAYMTTITRDELPLTGSGKVQRTVLKRHIKQERWVPLNKLFHSAAHRFVVVRKHSPLVEASRALYNHCWQPLGQDTKEYDIYLEQHTTLAAIDEKNNIAGQITFDIKDGALTCISICSANFRPRPVQDCRVPTTEEVESYVRSGEDPVIAFHTNMGAHVEKILAGGRPDDASACGYTVLLAYPVDAPSYIPDNEPISRQLIAAARIIGSDLSLDVYALSRPGGLAAYIAQKTKLQTMVKS